jgi:hypothetical protein
MRIRPRPAARAASAQDASARDRLRVNTLLVSLTA